MTSTQTPPAILGPKPNRKACGVDVMDAIYGRRAVRAYDAWKLGVRTIEQLIDAAIHAPSAMNEQPWSFVVVQDRALLRRISERSKALWRERIQAATPMTSPSYDVFHGATTLIVICARKSLWPSNEDCCLAAQNLMLAAHGLGLATCPIGLAREALNEPEFRREFAIPEGHTAVFPIVVGYPREAPEPSSRRPPLILAWR